MPHVFLSYARQDFGRAKSVATALERAGMSVWWDRHLGGGSEYSKEIEQALEAAAAVVVLWSKASVDSAWVRDEAAKGRDSRRLIPATLDGTPPPLGFGQIHTIDLRNAARGVSGGLQQIVSAAQQKLSAPSAPIGLQEPVSGSNQPAPWKRPIWNRRAPIIGALLLAALAIGVLYWIAPFPSVTPKDEPGGTVAVGEFEALSRDQDVQRVARLAADAFERTFSTNFIDTVKIGSATPAALREADLGVNGAVDRQGGELGISASIVDARSGATLWSTERTRLSGEGRQLANELALSVADVLRCSIQIKTRMEKYESPELVSRILRLCEALRSRGEQWAQIPSIAQELVKAAPESGDAHGYLAIGWALGSESRRDEVYQAARKALDLDPRNGPARFAVAAVPNRGISFAKRERLLRDGMRLDPGFEYNEAQLPFLLMTLGRLDEATRMLDNYLGSHPLDFQIRSSWAFQLARSGNLRKAREEFRRIDHLRPGSVIAARDAIAAELMFGDPREARRLLARWNPGTADRTCLSFVIDAQLAKRTPSAGEVTGNCPTKDLFPPELLIGLFGKVDEVYSFLDQNFAVWAAVPRLGPRFLYYPHFEAVRADPRFMPTLARLGIPQNWLATGNWPDFCRSEALPYDCRRAAEAAVAKTGG